MMDYLYDELSPSDREAFERQMSLDPALKAEVESLQSTRVLVASAMEPPQAPPMLMHDLMREARKAVAIEPQPTLFEQLASLFMHPAFGAAALVLVVAVTGVLMTQQSQDMAEPLPGDDMTVAKIEADGADRGPTLEGAAVADRSAVEVEESPAEADGDEEKNEALAAAPAEQPADEPAAPAFATALAAETEADKDRTVAGLDDGIAGADGGYARAGGRFAKKAGPRLLEKSLEEGEAGRGEFADDGFAGNAAPVVDTEAEATGEAFALAEPETAEREKNGLTWAPKAKGAKNTKSQPVAGEDARIAAVEDAAELRAAGRRAQVSAAEEKAAKPANKPKALQTASVEVRKPARKVATVDTGRHERSRGLGRKAEHPADNLVALGQVQKGKESQRRMPATQVARDKQLLNMGDSVDVAQAPSKHDDRNLDNDAGDQWEPPAEAPATEPEPTVAADSSSGSAQGKPARPAQVVYGKTGYRSESKTVPAKDVATKTAPAKPNAPPVVAKAPAPEPVRVDSMPSSARPTTSVAPSGAVSDLKLPGSGGSGQPIGGTIGQRLDNVQLEGAKRSNGDLEVAMDHYRNKRYDQAIKGFERTLKRGKGRAETELNLARSYKAVGQKRDAVAQYRLLLKRHPAYRYKESVLVETARLETELGNLDAARELLQQAVAGKGNTAKARKLLKLVEGRIAARDKAKGATKPTKGKTRRAAKPKKADKPAERLEAPEPTPSKKAFSQ